MRRATASTGLQRLSNYAHWRLFSPLIALINVPRTVQERGGLTPVKTCKWPVRETLASPTVVLLARTPLSFVKRLGYSRASVTTSQTRQLFALRPVVGDQDHDERGSKGTTRSKRQRS